MKPMTAEEQEWHEQVTLAIRSCLSSLRLTRCQDEDIVIAAARLDNWLTENAGSWVK